jgi:hypothetical protein
MYLRNYNSYANDITYQCDSIYLEKYMVLYMKMGNGKVGRIENQKSWVKEKI